MQLAGTTEVGRGCNGDSSKETIMVVCHYEHQDTKFQLSEQNPFKPGPACSDCPTHDCQMNVIAAGDCPGDGETPMPCDQHEGLCVRTKRKDGTAVRNPARWFSPEDQDTVVRLHIEMRGKIARGEMKTDENCKKWHLCDTHGAGARDMRKLVEISC